MSQIMPLYQKYWNYSISFKGLSERTLRANFYIIINKLVEESGIQNVQDLKRRDIEEFIIRGKLEKSWSPKTIKNQIQSISAFLKWCVDQEYISKNPTDNIPKPKVPRRVPKHLSEVQARELLLWTENYPYFYEDEKNRAIAIIAMFIFTGVRFRELLNIKTSHVDLESAILLVEQGKGGKERIIPLNNKLIRFLRKYLQQRKKNNNKCPYFFTSLKQDKKMSMSVIHRLVKKLRTASGIYFFPHLLRHTFAVMMLEGGANIYSLSKLMGHSDISTTTLYLTATSDHLKEQIELHKIAI